MTLPSESNQRTLVTDLEPTLSVVALTHGPIHLVLTEPVATPGTVIEGGAGGAYTKLASNRTNAMTKLNRYLDIRATSRI
jgi:hypothetical protein